MAATLLINTVSSDDMFGYWSGCCHDSERVPKILKYIKRISFSPAVPTANINFMKGDLMIGTRFFLDHIDGPEDFLFILLHERNHLILRKLYPDVLTPDYPGHLFNFGEDVYINAISRRHLPSMLPERYYSKPMELLLTARHNLINWEHFNRMSTPQTASRTPTGPCTCLIIPCSKPWGKPGSYRAGSAGIGSGWP